MPARVNPDVPGEPRLLKAVGRRLRELRTKRGLTMAELGANRKGVVYFQRQYVWKMETGRVAPSLAAALRDGVIAGAGLDVYEREPTVEPGLLALENVVLLPHIASASEATRTRMAVRATENILAFLDGKPLLDPVP